MWGRQGGRKGIHLLRWEVLIRPKEIGGANIKSAKMMNWAMLAKLAWRLLSGESRVWSHVIR